MSLAAAPVMTPNQASLRVRGARDSLSRVAERAAAEPRASLALDEITDEPNSASER